MSIVPIRSPELDAAEVSWFVPLCGDDFEFLGVADPALRSTWPYCRDVVTTADRLGYGNVLCPSSYVYGQDTLSFCAAVAPLLRQIQLLAAVRCGEVQPLMLARALATIDHMLDGRLTVNVISSDLPGEKLASGPRYARSREVVEILRQVWTRETVDFRGDFYRFEGVPTEPARPLQTNGGPLLYFGGYSPEAKALCAEHCDVYLMWPETEDRLAKHMEELSALAATHGRTLDFGLRVHVVVRETEDEARAAAKRLVSRLDDEIGRQLRERAQDATSLGVSKQAEMRDLSDDDGYAEPHLWTEIGRARSGCGAALVGDPDQIFEKLERYRAMGIRAFILSGYPAMSEADLFARHVLPRLPKASLPRVQGRIPARPAEGSH